MTFTEAAALFKCLGDESRLRILSLLAESDSYVELLASRLELTPGTVSHHLKKLESLGLVSCSRSQFYMIYRLDRDALGSLADLIPSCELPDDEKYRSRVLASFIENGRLLALPTQQKKRELVLRELVGDFDFDRDYAEREVNEILTRRFDDYCTLRRELVGAGLMVRENGIYRRVGL